MHTALSCPAEWAADYENPPTRRSLVSRLRDLEDNASWRSFFDAYWRLIYNVARKSGLAEAEAQDVVQETVIAVARKLPEFHYDPARGSFKKWLLVITRRRVHDHLRRVYRSLPGNPAGLDELSGLAENVVDPLLTPDAHLDAVWEEEWRENLLQAALARLRKRAAPKHYQAFDFCVLRKLPPGDVATMLGLSKAQVYLAKHRLLLSLKRTVADLESERGWATRT